MEGNVLARENSSSLSKYFTGTDRPTFFGLVQKTLVTTKVNLLRFFNPSAFTEPLIFSWEKAVCLTATFCERAFLR